LAGECGYSGVLGFSTKRSTTAIAVLDGDEIHLARAGTAWESRVSHIPSGFISMTLGRNRGLTCPCSKQRTKSCCIAGSSIPNGGADGIGLYRTTRLPYGKKRSNPGPERFSIAAGRYTRERMDAFHEQLKD
jgi:hypothetical protein